MITPPSRLASLRRKFNLMLVNLLRERSNLRTRQRQGVYHRIDPFDPMLVAQAALESLTLLTSDGRLAAYNVRLMMA